MPKEVRKKSNPKKIAWKEDILKTNKEIRDSLNKVESGSNKILRSFFIFVCLFLIVYAITSLLAPEKKAIYEDSLKVGSVTFNILCKPDTLLINENSKLSCQINNSTNRNETRIRFVGLQVIDLKNDEIFEGCDGTNLTNCYVKSSEKDARSSEFIINRGVGEYMFRLGGVCITYLDIQHSTNDCDNGGNYNFSKRLNVVSSNDETALELNLAALKLAIIAIFLGVIELAFKKFLFP